MRWILALFGRNDRHEAAPLYGALVALARRPDWYEKGGLDDTIDGRFALLSTLVALATLRLEQPDAEQRDAVMLAESYIADMDAQMRQQGFGDPSLGKEVRKLVRAMAERVERFRAVARADVPFEAAVRRAVYRDREVDDDAFQYTVSALQDIVHTLRGTSAKVVMQGDLG